MDKKLLIENNAYFCFKKQFLNGKDYFHKIFEFFNKQ